MKATGIKRAACVGSGVIGSSWVIQFAMRRLAVTLYGINDEQLKKSGAQMHKSLDTLEQFNAITLERRGGIVVAIRLTTSMEEAVADAWFIQESSPERLEIKRSIPTQVEACAAADAPYTNSTSGLPASDIAARVAHPERCMGVHPYNPSHLIPLVGLTSGDKTNPALFWPAYDFYQSIGKETVLLHRECPGFIANRLQPALYREIQDLVMRRVCSVEDVDKALVYGPDLRWAIFGHSMIIWLGNPDGLTSMVNMLDNSGDRWPAGMASWTHRPDNWAEMARPGMDKEMKHPLDYTGHTNEACAARHDQMFIELLKPHKKL